jgi:hypothetical protein
MRDNQAGPPVTYAVVPRPPTAAVEEALLPPPARQPRVRRRLVLTVLAVAVFVAALLVIGLDGLIPFGLLLAFSTDSDEQETRRSVILTPRNLGLAAAMVAAFAWFWLWHRDLSEPTLVMIAGALIALPLALQESASDAAHDRTIVVTKRSLILALWGLVVFVYLYYELGQSFNVLTAVCIVLPLSLTASRAWRARRGQVELGLLRHPLRRELRGHLVQGLNIWLCCGLLGGILAAGGVHYARIAFSLNAAQFNAVIAAFAAGLVLLAALAVVPRRRVYLATNVVVALLSGFLALQLVHIHPALRCDSARRTTGRRVVRIERRPQRPAQRSLPEREQRCRLPADGDQRAHPHRRRRRPADRLPRLRLARAGAGRRTDRRSDRRLPRHATRYQR